MHEWWCGCILVACWCGDVTTGYHIQDRTYNITVVTQHCGYVIINYVLCGVSRIRRMENKNISECRIVQACTHV